MSHDSFAFVPNEEVDEFFNQTSTGTIAAPPAPPLPPLPSPQDILGLLPPPTNTSLSDPSPVAEIRQESRRIRIETTPEQLASLQQLFHQSGDTLTPSELIARTRMSKSTVSRLLQRLRRGEDITVKPKRGRPPKHTPNSSKSWPVICVLGTTH